MEGIYILTITVIIRNARRVLMVVTSRLTQ